MAQTSLGTKGGTKRTGTRVPLFHAGSMRRAPGPDSPHKSERKRAAGDIIANMSTLELSDEQVISLVRGLPADRKRAALLALAQDAQVGREVDVFILGPRESCGALLDFGQAGALRLSSM